jgi:hypothetical protein
MDENEKGISLVPWYVTYTDYKKQNGYLKYGKVSVNWMLPDSDEIEVRYSINEIE